MVAKLSFLSPENPWRGLAAFNEADALLFYGRDQEVHELWRLVKRESLTVLYARSGLGKTSLLRAGLFPRLREDGFCPVSIRLDFSGGEQPLRTLMLDSLLTECRDAGIDAPLRSDAESLWEYFHRVDVEFWDSWNRLVVPVLAFDQFEEIFSVGQRDDLARIRTGKFLLELGDLIENRPPKHLKEALYEHPQMAQEFHFRKLPCKVILSFREDYLADIEELRREIPSLGSNTRFRLQPMNGEQAMQVVLQSGGHLVSHEVATSIVRMAAGSVTAERTRELEVEPLLLSLICSQLNDRRRQIGQTQITSHLVYEAGGEILSGFYERSVSDLDHWVRYFVEDNLLTNEGYRDSYALEDAVELPGISREVVDTLVQRRLLRVEERFGVRRLELAHDVLTQVVQASRDRRRRKEVAKRRWLVGFLAGVLAATIGGAVWFYLR